MRNSIVHPRAGQLVYEIRRIVQLAKKMEAAGMTMSWENIGDPVVKNEQIPGWIVDHLKAVAEENKSWGYSPSKGVDITREYVAGMNNSRGGMQITPEEVFFYNGLGDAVSKLYGMLDPGARVLCPSPSYSIHATHESFHAGKPPLLYHLDPANEWLPDIDEIRALVKANPEVSGILLINPDNPTGSVWPGSCVREVVEVAREFKLFVIADEIYNRLTFNGKSAALLSSVIGDVPGFSLKGISKEYPWPGSRCGWFEVYNADRDPQFRQYVAGLFDAKMIEVCSTTQPQMTIPRVMADARYAPHIESRCKAYGERSIEFHEAFEGLNGVWATKPCGAFYACVIFEPGMLNGKQSLKVSNPAVKTILDQALTEKGLSADKRFVLNLLASCGICVVPMTGFTSQLEGFRMTLLETSADKRKVVLSTLREKIEEYLAS